MKSETIKRLNLFLIFVLFLLIVIRWKNLPPQVPLFFSRPWGEEQLAKTPFLFLLPLVCLIVFLTNLALVRLFLKNKGEFWVQTSYVVSLFFCFICTISLFKIIFFLI